jgi:hypothetical protein
VLRPSSSSQIRLNRFGLRLIQIAAQGSNRHKTTALCLGDAYHEDLIQQIKSSFLLDMSPVHVSS